MNRDWINNTRKIYTMAILSSYLISRLMCSCVRVYSKLFEIERMSLRYGDVNHFSRNQLKWSQNSYHKVFFHANYILLLFISYIYEFYSAFWLCYFSKMPTTIDERERTYTRKCPTFYWKFNKIYWTKTIERSKKQQQTNSQTKQKQRRKKTHIVIVFFFGELN